MNQAQTEIIVESAGQGLTDFTQGVVNWVKSTGIEDGLLTLFCRHTSASLTIQENADPDVLRDLQDFFKGIAREDPALYRHTCEGPDDMPAHIRSALTDVSLSIPVAGGRLALGTWQGIYLFEHRTRTHKRSIRLHLLGE